ncbi:aldolase/citrate lyase family protein [Micromonospora tulbaghiae]|uniref:aldolase/citrate lyase family protein n=1 Tax=Micromonospora tulbaghiae TaxID=479978 RepID=UPI0033E028A5
MLDTPMHPLVESAVGLASAYPIAATHPVMASLGLGEAELRSDVGVSDDDGLFWARGRIVVAARAAGLQPPAMSVYTDVTDRGALATSCATGRRLGLLGRAAIHPRQFPVIVDAFRAAGREAGRTRSCLRRSSARRPAAPASGAAGRAVH